MHYLRLTCPELAEADRQPIAAKITDELIDLFYNPRAPGTREDQRERTTVHFAPYGEKDFFIGEIPAHRDITAELSDWHFSTKRRKAVTRSLTPILAKLFGAEMDHVNTRFHSYHPTEFSVGGKLLSERVRPIGRLLKRLFG